MILPQEVLDIPRYGCLNVHASLLPKYRGAAPIERAILAGEREAGICIMRMEAGLDTGDYCISRSCEIGDMSSERLTDELADKGACALISALYEIESRAGFAGQEAERRRCHRMRRRIEKGELNLDPNATAFANQRRVQASSGAHPSRCSLAGKTATLVRTSLVSSDDAEEIGIQDMQAGSVAFVRKRLFIGCADGALEVCAIKPDGKKEMDAASFASGVQDIKSGTKIWEQV